MPRIKVRSPAGSHILTLDDTSATVSTLSSEISRTTSLTGDLDIKYGYPPKPLRLSDYASNALLSALPIKLQGEQLIISASSSNPSLRGTGSGIVKNAKLAAAPTDTTAAYTPSSSTHPVATESTSGFSFSTGATTKKAVPSNKPSDKPLNLTRAAPKFNKDDPPDVRLSSGRGTVVLRVMDDDNSCLFRALSYVMGKSMYSVEELRQVIAGTIQSNPEMYSEAVLEQKPDAYCEWIKMESSWGGGIELGIFAEYFDMEICTIDVATGNMIRFNEGKNKRVIVVYSGIHYDAVALSPAGSLVHDSDNDETVFSKDDAEVLMGAKEMCQKLKQKNYFTDTKNFDIRCNVCKKGLKGEMEAVTHAKATGHSDFGEFKD